MISVDKSHGELYAASPAPAYGDKGEDVNMHNSRTLP